MAWCKFASPYQDLEFENFTCGDHLGSVLICKNKRTQIWPWRPNSKMILKWRSSQNFYVIEVSNFYLGMWGSFGDSTNLPKPEDSDLTMKARLKTDPKIKVIPKLLCYSGLKLLPWYVGIIWGQYLFAKTRGLRTDHGGQTQDWSWNEGHPKTSMLLRSQTSSLACGDHLGSVLICQNERTQILP